MSQKANTIGVLNSLIQMHYDRIEGYKLASKVLRDNDEHLLNAFKNCSEDSKNYIAQLAEHIWGLDGKTRFNTSLSGKIFRMWMSIRGAMIYNKGAIISLCLFGEYAMQKAYETAQYRQDEISEDAAKLINMQQAVIKRNYQYQKDHFHMPLLAG